MENRNNIESACASGCLPRARAFVVYADQLAKQWSRFGRMPAVVTLPKPTGGT